jgi:hypothetical protein
LTVENEIAFWKKYFAKYCGRKAVGGSGLARMVFIAYGSKAVWFILDGSVLDGLLHRLPFGVTRYYLRSKLTLGGGLGRLFLVFVCADQSG